MIQIKRLNYILLKTVIVLIVFNGFLTNFISIGTVRAGTMIFDLFLVVLTVYCAAVSPVRVRKNSLAGAVFLLCFVMFFFVMLISVLAFSSMYESVAGIRNHILYIAVFILTASMLDKNNVEDIFVFLCRCMMFINGFAIFQAVMHKHLPAKLLIVEGATDFAIFGVSEYRCTGLVGDMLAMGSFANMTLLLYTIYLYKSKRPFYHYLLCLLPICACFLTFSRASIGLCLALVVLFLLIYFIKRKSYNAVLICITSTVALLTVMITPLGQRILARFLSSDANQGSDSSRLASYRASVRAIRKHPLLGLGFGTQMPSGRSGIRLVTDGHLWECLLEMGIPLFVIMMCFYASTVYLAFKYLRRRECRYYATAYIILSGYFFIISLVNSALDSRADMCIFMMLLGFVVYYTGQSADPGKEKEYEQT